MTKKNYYLIEKNINKILRKESTNFLDPQTYKKISQKIKNYKTYYPYKDCEKTIIYTDLIPQIKLLEIISKEKLTHREILGSLFSLNISQELFGDIIIDNNHYYIMIIPHIYDYLITNFNKVSNNYITLKEVELDVLQNYQRKYQEITIIVSSLRIDTIISNLLGTSRDSIKTKFLKDEIILNYEICHKLTYNLKTGDIFSIRKHGKYKFDTIINTSKKGHYIIRCYKYIDN